MLTKSLTSSRQISFKFPNLASKHDRSEFSDVESSSELSSPVKSTSRPLVQREDDYDDDDDDGESERANKSICFEINNAINSEEGELVMMIVMMTVVMMMVMVAAMMMMVVVVGDDDDGGCCR